jgi:hypothetical protein
LEAAARREYEVNDEGYFKVDFRELHHIFSAGRRGALIEETAQALEALSSRKFNIIDPEKKAKGQIISEEKSLFTFDGNARLIDEIRIHRIFDYNVNGYFFRLPANFLKTLTEAIQTIDPKGRITNADIILSLYAHQIRHNGRPQVKKDIKTLAEWSGMDALLNTWQSKRIAETVERGAKALKLLQVITGYRVENDNITLFFCREAQSVTAKRKAHTPILGTIL